jgi:DNA-binding GntR family transcriptional regulator
MIFRQELSPGQRLIYRDLSLKLNISQTPVVTALNRLEQEGFLICESFRGFYIKPIDIQEAWDLFGVREALEV